MSKEKNIQCIGFILDGNRRYARAKGLATLAGHTAGMEALQNIVTAVHERHIPHMVCYAFSTENWNRTEEEVFGLTSLFEKGIQSMLDKLTKENRRSAVAMQFIGQRERFSSKIQKLMVHTEKENPEHPELTVWLLLSYGGRVEIIDAVNRAVRQGAEVTEKSFSELLWTSGMPDPDLIIRTGGEERLSNFLPWQSVYSELMFTETYWPEFDERALDAMLAQYAERQRRHGK